MFYKSKQVDATQEAYKKKIQDYNQLKWQDDPISIEELIFSDYDDLSAVDGDKPKKEIVFIDTNFDLDWITSYSLDDHAQHLVNDIMVMTSLPYKHFPKEHQLSFLRILGQGIVAAFSKNDEDVKRCREQASSFHKQVSLDLYKKLRLQISTVIFAIVVFVFNIVNFFVHLDNLVLSAALWGFIGAYLSVSYKNGKNDVSYSINCKFVLWDIVGRFVIGTIFGIVACYFTSSILFKMDPSIRTKENIVIIALIAGFSEKFIPNLIGKYENKFFKGE